MIDNDSARCDLDERFLQALRSIARQKDPEPSEVIAGAVSAFSWRTIDAELSTLT